ncbi:MAG TPA: T9SS type A sorting domain-containing protein [Chitinophagales bacterium]|nr:T9SS type A sorting domain-containing protein [Chitinophagales bacterium]
MRIWKLMTLAGLMITIYAGKAQNPKQANIWYFGYYAGLDFTNGNPVALTNSAMWASEGSCVASDYSGNLQFYSNGGEYGNQTGAVWNRNHQIMPNGYLGNLSGCASSIQSSLALKKPGSPAIYYLFSTDCYENGLEKGLTYSIIDMSLEGGLGDVVVKGEPLKSNVNESLTSAVHSNQKDYWVITHIAHTDTFYAYHFTGSGIAGVVKSKAGPATNEYAGEIKVSANGERLVYCGSLFTGLFDFDASTGIVSNYRDLNVGGFTASFSPNCELLYVADFINKKIFQFDMLAYNVANTKVQVGSSATRIGSLQMGPDGKIYVAIRNSEYLGVITRPNIKGTDCNFVENGIILNGKFSNYGLPNFANNVLGECRDYPEENVSIYNHAQFLVNQIGPNQINLGWMPSPGATQYRISMRKAADVEWETFTVSSDHLIAENLQEATEYEFRMDALIYPNAVYEFIYHHQFDNVVNQKHASISEVFKAKTTDELNFDVYPNPAKENASIDFYLNKNSFVEIILLDLNGKIVFQSNMAGKSGFQHVDVPVDGIQNGIYQVSLKNENTFQSKKLIVMN